MEGYSGTPLAKKLGIKEGFKIYVVNPPKYYRSLFLDFPINTEEIKKPKEAAIDFIHVFYRTNTELTTQTSTLKAFLKKNGSLWISWPKGTSKIKTDINREIIREYMLSQIGLVDIKVAAIDKDWSGLKFVYRMEDRK